MTKTFTLLAAAAMAFAAQAAAPQFVFRGEPVSEGATCTTGYTYEVNVEDLGDWGVFTTYSYLQDAHMALRGEGAREVTVQLESTAKVMWCGLTEQCIMTNSQTRSNTLNNAPEAVIDGDIATATLKIDKTNDFEEEIDPATTLDQITVNLSAWYTDSPAEKATVTVVLTNRPDSECGIAAVAVDKGSVKYTRGRIDYNIAGPAKLNVYTTSGALAMSRLVSGQGTVSLDALHPGVYVYSLNGHTGKILIRK